MDRETFPPASPPEIDLPRLRASIERHEGRRRRPYKDSEGVLTVGVGHNLEVEIMARSWSDSEIDRLLGGDIAAAAAGAKTLVSAAAWRGLGAARREVLVEMVFQLGRSGVRGFRRFREALEAGDFEWAAGEMLYSKWTRARMLFSRGMLPRSLWHRQTPARCERLAEIMRTGTFRVSKN